MNKEAELLLSLGLPVWVSCYRHKLDSIVAQSNLRATEVTRKGDAWISSKNKRITGFDPATDIQPTREAAITHYNQSIDNSLAAMYKVVDGRATSLMKKKYKV